MKKKQCAFRDKTTAGGYGEGAKAQPEQPPPPQPQSRSRSCLLVSRLLELSQGYFPPSCHLVLVVTTITNSAAATAAARKKATATIITTAKNSPKANARGRRAFTFATDSPRAGPVFLVFFFS